MKYTKEGCGCYANYYGNVVHCPKHAACDDMYEALRAVKYGVVMEGLIPNGLTKQELQTMLDEALAKAEGKGE